MGKSLAGSPSRLILLARRTDGIEGEEIYKKLYLRTWFRNIEPRGGRYIGRSCTPGCSGRPQRCNTLLFLHEDVEASKKLSARARFSLALRRQRDPFISAGLLDAADVRTKVLALCGKGWRSFFPLGRRSAQKREREELASFPPRQNGHKEYRALPSRSPPLYAAAPTYRKSTLTLFADYRLRARAEFTRRLPASNAAWRIFSDEDLR